MITLKYLVLIFISLFLVSDGYGMDNQEKNRKSDQEYQDHNKKIKEAEEDMILVENSEKNIEEESIKIILFDGLKDTSHLKQCLYCSYFVFNNGEYQKVVCPKCKVIFCWECKKKCKENMLKNCLC